IGMPRFSGSRIIDADVISRCSGVHTRCLTLPTFVLRDIIQQRNDVRPQTRAMEAPIGAHKLKRLGPMHRITAGIYTILRHTFVEAGTGGMTLAERLRGNVLKEVGDRT